MVRRYYTRKDSIGDLGDLIRKRANLLEIGEAWLYETYIYSFTEQQEVKLSEIFQGFQGLLNSHNIPHKMNSAQFSRNILYQCFDWLKLTSKDHRENRGSSHSSHDTIFSHIRLKNAVELNPAPTQVSYFKLKLNLVLVSKINYILLNGKPKYNGNQTNQQLYFPLYFG
jgi:hypothetical protein